MRLIDADALHFNRIRIAHEDGTVGGYNTVVMSAEIKDAPTLDAVPVVRCKDCRWKEEEQPGMVYCPAVVGGWVDEDWFCKGGERSEE